MFSVKTRAMRATLTSSFALMVTVYAASAVGAVSSSSSALVTRGKYLASAGDCMACHTAEGGQPFAGGRYIETPFGAMASPNITPDKATGIGNWTDAQFYRTMHDGLGRKGEYLYPVMPFPWYSKVTPDDSAAIKAYLFSLAPVTKPRLPDRLRFPYSVRESLLAWRVAFFKPETFKPDPRNSDEVNRGAYLAEGLAHCGECHNARPVAGTSSFKKSLQGGSVDNWYAPNITSDVRDGIGAWSTEDIAKYLKTGSAPGKGVALGPMAETIHSLSALTDADLHAIAAYLKSTPASGGDDRTASLYRGADARGGGTYISYCASCHGVDGAGVAGAVPKLVGNGAVTAKGPQNVISVVLGGLPSRDRYGPMPAIGASMSDEEVAEVSNYVRQLGGNTAPATAQAGMVAALRKTTDTPLNAAPNSACPAIAPAAVAKAIADPHTGLTNDLSAMTDADMYQQTQRMVVALRKAAPRASQADVVNGLTAAYCPIVRGNPQFDSRAQSLRLGQFSELVYSQLHTGIVITGAR
jgi:mono/diheme cytochrome c family protein